MRRGFTVLREQNSVLFDGIMKTALANAEAQAGDHAAALATLELATLESGRTGQHWFDAELYRTRGEILLEQDPSGFARRRRGFPRRDRDRARSESPQLRAARLALPCQALSREWA